jgi:prolyl oligopeptidase
MVPRNCFSIQANYKAGATTIRSIVPSWDGKYVAMGLTLGGAEWSEIRVLDVEQGTLLPESIYPSWSPYGWAKDSKAFFYDSPKVTDIKSLGIELNQRTKVHKLGTKTAANRDIFSNESNPELGIAAKEWPVTFIREYECAGIGDCCVSEQWASGIRAETNF